MRVAGWPDVAQVSVFSAASGCLDAQFWSLVEIPSKTGAVLAMVCCCAEHPPFQDAAICTMKYRPGMHLCKTNEESDGVHPCRRNCHGETVSMGGWSTWSWMRPTCSKLKPTQRMSPPSLQFWSSGPALDIV
jgi:hypothetical protein